MDQTLREVRGRSHFRLRLLIDGLIIGVVAGGVITAYRLGISTVSGWLHALLGSAGEGRVLPYLCLMVLMGAAAGLCTKFAPLISGSGIPQVSAQLAGRLRVPWWRVLPGKFIGGLLTLGGGLTMGREGPSVQIGASVGQAFGDLARRPLSARNFLISSGAAAGLAAAFNAPIAGVVFAMEELHKSFSGIVLVGATAASFASAFVGASIMGFQPVLHVAGHELLPLRDYWLILLLGAATGLSGVFFNKCILWGKALYGRLRLPWYAKGILPFALTAGFCLALPELFGSGEPMIFYPTEANPAPEHLIALYGLKLLLLVLAFGSGLPGGIFFPLLVLGSLVGNAMGQLAVAAGVLEPEFVLTLTLMAMTGHFSSIVRSPLTGILLISEMTGSFAFMLPLGIVAMTSYTVAELCHSTPVYESLQRLLPVSPQDDHTVRRSMLTEFAVEPLSQADGRTIADLEWPGESLIIAVKRGAEEIVPHGGVKLMGGDYLVLLIPAEKRGEIQERVERLTRLRL